MNHSYYTEEDQKESKAFNFSHSTQYLPGVENWTTEAWWK